MAYKILYSKDFLKGFQSLSKHEQKQAKNKIEIMSTDPRHPSLRSKPIKASKKRFEASVNMSIRIFWEYEGEGAIRLLEIGHHDILKRY